MDGLSRALERYARVNGIDSRIEETLDEIRARVRAGKLYVNRNIIGAVVGVQPFRWGRSVRNRAKSRRPELSSPFRA